MERPPILQNISLRYGRFSPIRESSSVTDNDNDVHTNRIPGGPITRRLSTDETDTESDTSSNPDETATDDGEEFLTNPLVRAQRQADARQRLDNTKQYLRECYGEAALQTNVLFIVLGKLWSWFKRSIQSLVLFVHGVLQPILAPLQQLFGAINHLPQHIIDLGHSLYFFTVDLLNRIFHFTIDVVTRIFLFTLDLLKRMFFSTLSLLNRLLRGLLNLLRYLILHLGQWTVYAAQVALLVAKNLLRLIIWILFIPLHLVYEHGQLALTVIVYLIVWGLFLSPFIAVGFSLMQGYKGTVNYVCNDTALRHSFTDLTGACNHPKLNTTLAMESQKLKELLETSQTIINENRLVHHSMKLNWTAYNDLLDGVTGMEWFVKEQRDRLSDPDTMDEIAEWMKSNITFIGNTSLHFFSEYQLRETEMMRYLESVLYETKGTIPDSASARFFSETLYALIPCAFAQTRTARQVQNYIRVAKKFQTDIEGLVQFDDPGSFSQAVRAIERGYDLVRDELAANHDLHEIPCDNDFFKKYKCSQTPQWTFWRFADAIPKAREWAVVWETAGKHHLGILRAGARLHVHLSGLLGDAVSRGEKVDAMSARAILRKFIVETGEVATSLGY